MVICTSYNDCTFQEPQITTSMKMVDMNNINPEYFETHLTNTLCKSEKPVRKILHVITILFSIL
jgi:hypothetical protein